MIIRTSSFLILIATLVACGGGSSGEATVPPPIQNASPGGIWVGTDSNGLDIYALSTESGRIHWVAPATEEQGFGAGTVSGNNVTFTYTYVAPFGFVLEDGSTSASCTASGTIQERQSLSVNVACTTSGGGSFNNSATLAYNSLYERNSSLATIAGNYDDFGLTLNVSGSGVVFEQDPDTGCVVNGQINIINAAFNAYDVSITYSSCQGNAAVLNGATFTGLGTLDNTAVPETAVVGLTGVIQGVTYSVVYVLPRI